MKCSEVIAVLERIAPRRCACDWDNPGLLAGRLEKEVNRILLTVDADDMAVNRAEETGTDLIVSHHPLIFKPVRRVTDDDFIGRRLVRMIRADIAYFAMHTNYDSAPGCMADDAAERMGIEGGAPLEVMGEEDGIPYGIGKIGALKEPLSGMDFARRIKEDFKLPFVTVYGGGLWENEPVRIAAVCPGSGGSMIGAAIAGGAQALVTGDISHHEGIDAAAQGLTVIDAGHYGLEYIFMDAVERRLRGELPKQLEIIKMPVEFPAVVL